MKTRQTRAIIWTDYPTPAEAADLAAHDAEPDSDRRAEIAGRIAPATQTRITLGTMSALQYARYQAALSDVRAWADEDTATADLIWLYGLTWAHFRGALVRMDERTASRTDDSAGAWQEIDPPAEWATLAGFLGDLPTDLIEQIGVVALELNPSLRASRPATTDEAKKNGGATVE